MRFEKRKPFLIVRARIIQAIRRFFINQSYLEVETPIISRAPAPETHIDAIPVGDMYLQTSPELCMKRLLAAGYSKIFQICKCFRKGERGDLHLPEFTMLEWYCAEMDYRALMEECEALVQYVSRHLELGEQICYQGREINLQSPWQRISVHDAFLRYSNLSPEKALERGLFEEILVNDIEPHLGVEKPTVLYDYPSSLAALARLKPGSPGIAERFEIYMGGLELANAFSELNDAKEQRHRFEKEKEKRMRMNKEIYPIPEKFLDVMENMPESAGIALGIDRLVMIFTDRSKVDDIVCFTPEES